jgi:lipoprotein signal peptidase
MLESIGRFRIRPSVSAEGSPRRRRTDREPNRGWRPIAALALAVALLDWSTKALIAATIPLGELVVVIDDRIAFWHVKNPALILGLLGGVPLEQRKIVAALLGLVGLVLLVEVVIRAHRLLPHRRPWAWLFAGLVLGGMMGNLGERALHWGVTDFLSFRWGHLWLPPGNVADLAIFASIPIALLVIVFELEGRSLRRSRARHGNPGPEPARTVERES